MMKHPKKQQLHLLSVLTCSALLFGACAWAQAVGTSSFAQIDDFEGPEGALDGRLGLWFSNGGQIVVDPANATNRVAGFIGGSGDRGSHIPAIIANGQTGTLFFRLRVDSDNSDPGTPVLNWSVGMSDVVISGNGAFGDYEAQLNQNRDAGNVYPDHVRIRDAGLFITLTPLQAEVWYKVWMVIDNEADTTQVYMQGGQFSTQTLVQGEFGESSFTFRNSGAGPAANNLVRFFVRLAGSHAGSLYLDDLWLNSAKLDLSDPTTKPVADLPPTLSGFNPRSGATFHPAAEGISFQVASADPGGIPANGITMVLNGVDVSANLIISGPANEREVRYSGLQEDTVYSVMITARDASGRERQATISFDTRRHYVLPGEFAFPLTAARGDAPGFTARITQVYDLVVLPSSEARAESQLAGELIDPATGEAYMELSSPGTNLDGSYNQALINWNINSGLGAEQGNFRAPGFPDDPIPGIFVGYNDNIAGEILAYLELPAGLHTLGVNSDDGFVLSAGVDHRDSLRVSVGRFDGARGSADSLIQFVVETPGLYPFRLVWYQGSGGANLEWFSVDETGQKILINDRANPNSIKAWRALSVPSRPYVRSVSPRRGEGQVPLDAAIAITLQDGGTQVVPGSVGLVLNGQTVSPVVTKTGSSTLVTYAPPSNLPILSTNTLTLTYSDNATPAHVRTATSSFVTLRGRTQFNGFTLIDDFEGALGPLNGRFGEWFSNGGEVVNDPAAAANRVAGFVGGTGDRGSHIEATIAEGQTGTLFFRLMVGSDNSDLATPVLNWSVGMSDVAISGNGGFGDYEAQLNQNRDAGNDFPEEVRVRDGSVFTSLEELEAQVWYKFWLVIDNQNDTTQVFAEGGRLATRTLLQSRDGASTFTFRNSAAGPQANDLIRFFVRLSGSHTGAFYLDDIWIAPTSSNMADPTESKPVAPATLNIARLGNELVLSWPAQGTDSFVLQSSASLLPANWSAVATAPVTSDGQKRVTVPITGVSGFYRLRAP
jgi:hypothetical protein